MTPRQAEVGAALARLRAGECRDPACAPGGPVDLDAFLDMLRRAGLLAPRGQDARARDKRALSRADARRLFREVCAARGAAAGLLCARGVELVLRATAARLGVPAAPEEGGDDRLCAGGAGRRAPRVPPLRLGGPRRPDERWSSPHAAREKVLEERGAILTLDRLGPRIPGPATVR